MFIYKEKKSQTDTTAFKKWFKNSKIVDSSGKPLVVYHGTNRNFNSFEKNMIGKGSGNYGHYGFGFYFSYNKKEAEGYGSNLLEVYLRIENPFDVSKQKNRILEYSEILNINNKENIAIDIDWLLKALYKKDPISFYLAELIYKEGQEKGWNVFRKYYPDYNESLLDLNDVSDWVEYAKLDDVYDSLDNKIIEDLRNQVGEPKLIKGFLGSAQTYLPYLTDLGDPSIAKKLTELMKDDGFDGVLGGSEIVVFEPNQIKSAISNNGNFYPNSSSMYESRDTHNIKREQNLLELLAMNFSSMTEYFSDIRRGIVRSNRISLVSSKPNKVRISKGKYADVIKLKLKAKPTYPKIGQTDYDGNPVSVYSPEVILSKPSDSNKIIDYDLKLHCNCMAFHWQGHRYRLSIQDGAIKPISIADPVWGSKHDGEGGLCKHLIDVLYDLDKLILKAAKGD